MKQVTMKIECCRQCPFRIILTPHCNHEHAWGLESENQGPRVLHTCDEVDSFPTWCPLPDTKEPKENNP